MTYAAFLGAATWAAAFRLLQIEEEYALPPVRPWTFYWWERLAFTAILLAGLVTWPLLILRSLMGERTLLSMTLPAAVTLLVVTVLLALFARSRNGKGPEAAAAGFLAILAAAVTSVLAAMLFVFWFGCVLYKE